MKSEEYVCQVRIHRFFEAESWQIVLHAGFDEREPTAETTAFSLTCFFLLRHTNIPDKNSSFKASLPTVWKQKGNPGVQDCLFSFLHPTPSSNLKAPLFTLRLAPFFGEQFVYKMVAEPLNCLRNWFGEPWLYALRDTANLTSDNANLNTGFHQLFRQIR